MFKFMWMVTASKHLLVLMQTEQICTIVLLQCKLQSDMRYRFFFFNCFSVLQLHLSTVLPFIQCILVYPKVLFWGLFWLYCIASATQMIFSCLPNFTQMKSPLKLCLDSSKQQMENISNSLLACVFLISDSRLKTESIVSLQTSKLQSYCIKNKSQSHCFVCFL